MALNWRYGLNVPREGEWLVYIENIAKSPTGMPVYTIRTLEPLHEVCRGTGRKGWKTSVPARGIETNNGIKLREGGWYWCRVEKNKNGNYKIIFEGEEQVTLDEYKELCDENFV